MYNIQFEVYRCHPINLEFRKSIRIDRCNVCQMTVRFMEIRFSYENSVKNSECQKYFVYHPILF